jgi:hypothetical protein
MTNNKLIQVVRVLVPLNMWLDIQFLTHMYIENSIEKDEHTLYALQVSQQILEIANKSRNIVSILR